MAAGWLRRRLINQIILGYHAGFNGLRLECTADTPMNTPIIDGLWQAWVR